METSYTIAQAIRTLFGRLIRLQVPVYLSFMTIFAVLAGPLNTRGQVCCPDFNLKDAVEICASDYTCGTVGANGGHTLVGCKLSTHTYTVFPNLGGYTYTWTITGGTPLSYTGNPCSVTWGSGSTGFIKVVINGLNGCHDSISQQICLIDGPKASFTAVPNPVCSGTPVNFTNTSAGGGIYLWDFGDGTTSTLANPPAHVYNTPGTYTVVLTAQDAGPSKGGTPDQRSPCGCIDTATVVITVLNGAGPVIETGCCFGTVCPGDTSSFCTPVTCPTYNWTVAGGTIISGAGTNCIKIKWNATYTVPTTVTLSTPGCTAAPCAGSTTLPVPVLYPNLPIQGPSPLCQGTAGSFFLPSMPGTYYTWTTTAPAGTYTFNEKDRNVANVSLTFNLAGTYQIQCVYTNPLAGCSGTSLFTVVVLPVFNVYGLDKVCQYSTQSYSGPGGNATWSISPAGPVPTPPFGPSTSFTFNTPGLYTITATPVPGSYCNLTAIKVVEVVAVPILGPITGPTTVCPGKNQSYQVTSNTSGSPFTWQVLSGTGTVQTMFGTDRSEAVIFFTGTGPWTIGVYQEIEISPGVLCQSLTQTLNVSKFAPPAVTGPTTVCVDDISVFNASGPVPPGGITWSIQAPFQNRGSIISGQGTSTVNIRWHGPPAAGVTVVASHCGGSGAATVTIMNPPATPGITANGPLTYCLPNMPAANFTLTATSGYCSYQWYVNGTAIPGATNSSYLVPASTFVPLLPSYIFKVVVSNCVCTASNSVQVLIGNCGGGGGTPPNPINCAIDFTVAPNPVCENQPATFTAVQVPPGPDPGFSYSWAFGDGATSFQSPTQHAYLAAGTYNVTLTATLGSCTTTAVHSVTVKPTPVCAISVPDTMFCPGSSILITGCGGQSSYQWYKDFTPISGATTSTYPATQHGEYWLEVSNTWGCTNTSNHIYLYEKALPTAKITGEGTVCATPGGFVQVQLSAYYNSNYSYSWSSNPAGATFSPNGSNMAFFTMASLTLPGTLPYTCAFMVKVTDTVTGCFKYDTLCVTFYESPTVTTNFHYGCEGTPVTLTATPGPLPPSQYYYHWSNGKTTQSVTVSAAGTYGVTVTDKVTGCSSGAIGAIINPLPDLSLFPHGCDTICDSAVFHLYIPLPLNALPPYNTLASAYSSITWYANANWGSPIGTGPNLFYTPPGPGNYQISVVVVNIWGCADTAGVFCLNAKHCFPNMGLDWGDAPDSPNNPADFPTLLASNGARHTIVPGVYLGTKVDAEPNGQPSVGADCDDNDCLYVSAGDDEDGVTIPAGIEIGNPFNISVVASVNGFLDGWIDYNIDADWADPGEHIFISQAVVAGLNTFTITVPATATMGQSYARFRFRTTAAPITFSGLVSDGEVEDYPVFIDECSQGDELDFGDAPDMPAVGYNYPTLLASNGARHYKYNNIRLGALIDSELNGQPNTPSSGDDFNNVDDEDGVNFVGTLYVGKPATVQVTASINGYLNAWMDYNKDGDWADPGEKIFTNQPLVAGVNVLTFNIPSTALSGKVYSRFRFNTIGGLNYYGLAMNGEVEDYRVNTCPYWSPIPTAVRHFINIPHNLANLTAGDVLGVFYHDNAGNLACAGLSEFDGVNDKMMVAYGDNPSTPVKDGFVVGEPIIWKLCSVVKGDANQVDVVYDFTYPNSNGLFVQNGLSALSDVIGLHVTAAASPSTICPGETVQLTANPGGAEGVAFTWTSLPAGFTSDLQNPVASPTVNTTYTVDAFDGVFHATSSVTVTVTEASPLVPQLPINNVVVASGHNVCYNATQVITAAGNGTTFMIESGGRAQLLAGQKVRLLPGTRAFSGSYLHGYITTGPFCCGVMPPTAPVSDGVPESEALPAAAWYSVYPNPTSGSFTLDLNGIGESATVTVEIYDILGARVLRRELTGVKRQSFDLTGKQEGMYLIRVRSGELSGLSKIIKQ